MLAGVAPHTGQTSQAVHRELADSTPHRRARHPQHSPARGGIGRRARPRKKHRPIGFPAPRHSRLRCRAPSPYTAPSPRAGGCESRLWRCRRPCSRRRVPVIASFPDARYRALRADHGGARPRNPARAVARRPVVAYAAGTAGHMRIFIRPGSWRRGPHDSALGRLDRGRNPSALVAGRQPAAVFSRGAEPRSHRVSAGRRSQ